MLENPDKWIKVIKKVGHHQAGFLLYELRRHLKGKAKPVPMTLMAELGGLSVYQAKRCVKFLRDNGYIETEQHLTEVIVGDEPTSRNFNHVRLTFKGEQVFK